MVANYLRILGDEKRGKILMLLSHCPLSASEIQELTNINQTNLSRHLKKLEEFEIISHVRSGKYKYYYLKQSFISEYAFIETILMEYKKECLKEKQNENIDFCVSTQKIEARLTLIDESLLKNR